MASETSLRVWRRYLGLAPDDAEEFIDFDIVLEYQASF